MQCALQDVYQGSTIVSSTWAVRGTFVSREAYMSSDEWVCYRTRPGRACFIYLPTLLANLAVVPRLLVLAGTLKS
jgi:hypothetical protein